MSLSKMCNLNNNLFNRIWVGCFTVPSVDYWLEDSSLFNITLCLVPKPYWYRTGPSPDAEMAWYRNGLVPNALRARLICRQWRVLKRRYAAKTTGSTIRHNRIANSIWNETLRFCNDVKPGLELSGGWGVEPHSSCLQTLIFE